MLKKIAENSLVWLPEKGIGHYPVKAFPYNGDYFRKYQEYAETEIGRGLTKARIDLVARHYSGQVVDVGIGCGQFVESRPETLGYDLNPVAVAWLQDRGLCADIYGETFAALSFWDSLEHIIDPSRVLENVREWAFVSIPVFRDVDHVLGSKHFRKDEHYWYFTDAGLVQWFWEQGFVLAERNAMEQDYGREDIMSYAFRRRNA